MQEFGNELLSESQLLAAECLQEFINICLARAENKKGASETTRKLSGQGKTARDARVAPLLRLWCWSALVVLTSTSWCPGETWDAPVRRSRLIHVHLIHGAYTTLVLTFIVLKLETKLLITSLESKLPFVLFH